jgi:hypothetical protein
LEHHCASDVGRDTATLDEDAIRLELDVLQRGAHNE